uniref:NADH-ubiquinone oxidoreductase chain 2 n=1 Tax=Comicus campestris TaxID=62773 RepID=A0A0N7ARZ9_9ORTH|nr:NADH dehydrogenase subunit 2 [Comicus campestris]AJW76381.1 NADH dehydrogenase subunit 2 [Comicus campestris]
MMMILGTLISISSNSWFGVWIGLEINLLSFIPLISNTKNLLTTESALKYFLIQTIGSSVLLFTVIMMHLSSDIINYMMKNSILITLSSTLLLKMGAAPFHFWFPGTMEGMDWINCFILMTWQKIAPMMLISYLISINIFFIMIMISCNIIGAIGGFNQTSLRKIMAYSSINHLGWMLAAMISNENLWQIYFIIYSFLSTSLVLIFWMNNLFHINQSFISLNTNLIAKYNLYLTLFSLGGLPPFLGFLPKWLVIESMLKSNLGFTIIVMIIFTLITLFYYLRISFSATLISVNEIKWNFSHYSETSSILMMCMSMISSLGLILCIGMSNIF